MHNRIREVRKDAHVTQDEFANSISLSSNYVYMIEHGTREPSERTIKDICRVYNVNETWLLTGEGAMHSPVTKQQKVAAITAAIFEDDNEFRSALIDAIVALDESQLNVLKEIADKMYENYKNNKED